MTTENNGTMKHDPLAKEAMESLRSAICPACGKQKLRGYVFCQGCFEALPEEKKKPLYRMLHGKFPQSFQAAKEFLKSIRKGSDPL